MGRQTVFVGGPEFAYAIVGRVATINFKTHHYFRSS